MKKYEDAAKKIINDYLKISKKERFFIITDSNTGFPGMLSKACYELACNMGINAKIHTQRRIEYGPADRRTVDFMKDFRKNDCLFLCLSGKLGNLYESFRKGFRMYLREKGVRFATMAGLEDLSETETVLHLLNHDYEKIKFGENLQKILDEGKEIEVSGKNGTKIKAKMDGRKSWFNSGRFWTPGQGGNLPIGSVNIFPIESSINGVVCADLSVKVGAETIKPPEPVKFTIENGEIISIEGDKNTVNGLYNDLNNFSFINSRHGFDPRSIFRIGEIGFGLLTAKPIGINFIDEKLFGVAHIANGNNYGKGGENKCRGHRQHLFWLDTIRVDGKILSLRDLII
jgi:hypothetical protein